MRKVLLAQHRKCVQVGKYYSAWAVFFMAMVFSSMPGELRADLTYTFHLDGVDGAIKTQIQNSVTEAVAIYNKYGSFNKHLNIYYNSGVPTAQANYDGVITFGGSRNTRVALHEILHTQGVGTYWAWSQIMTGGTWDGSGANSLLGEFGDATPLKGDGVHLWPYGLNYDNEDGYLARIRHVRIVAAVRSDMGLLSFVREPQSNEVEFGQTATFSVTAPVATSYNWYKTGNTQPLTNGGDISGATSDTLNIANVKYSDAGSYYCVISQSLASRPAILAVPEPLGVWDFQDNVKDRYGRFDGTAYGSPSYVTGVHGKAIDLDGSDDHITLPAGVADTKNITVSAWINWDGGGIWQRIFDFGNSTSDYMFLTPSASSGKMRFVLKNCGDEQYIETTAPTIGVWTHVAVTLNGSTTRLYVNGTLKASSSSFTISPLDFQPTNNLIGDSQWSSDPLYNGKIDQFMLWGYALDSSEIVALYDGLPCKPSPTSGITETATQLPLSWQGGYSQENSWQVYLSESQSIINAADTSSPAYCGVYRKPMYCTPALLSATTYYWRVDPVSNDGVVTKGNIWSFTTGPFSSPTSVAFTSNRIDSLAAESVPYSLDLSEYVTDAGLAIRFRKTGGVDWLNISPDGILSGTPDEGSAGLNHCSVQVSDENGCVSEAVVVIDVEDTCSGKNGIVDLERFAGDWLSTGTDNSPADLDRNTTVDLLDWSRIASDWLNVIEPGLVAYWPADESFGLDLADITGGHSGILHNMNQQWRPQEMRAGARVNSLAFDGIDDYVEMSEFAGVVGDESRSCTAWVKTSKAGGQMLCWGQSSQGALWLISVNNNGTLRAQVHSGYVYGTTVISDNKWHHIAVTLGGVDSPNVSDIKLYVDGKRETIGGLLDCPIYTSANGHVTMGAYLISPNYYQGMLDDVKLYDRVLSEDEIEQQAFNGLQIYLSLDEADGEMIYDSRVGDFVAVAVNGTQVKNNAGMNNDCLYFDGLDDYVLFPSYNGVSGTQSRSCCAWIKTDKVGGYIFAWGESARGALWAVRVNDNGTLRAQVYNGYVYGTTVISENKWHHIAVTLDSDGTPDVSDIKLYVDGKLETVGGLLDCPINTSDVNNATLGIYLPSQGYYRGYLDDVLIYNRALTKDEILQLQ